MTRRQILYIILSFIITTLLLLTVAVILILSQKKDVQVVWADVEEQKVEKKRKKGKWEDRDKEAIALVRKLKVVDPASRADKKRRRRGEEPEQISLGDLAARDYFEDTFKIKELEPLGWRARYLRGSYYFVSHHRSDGLVTVGPTWLVDLKTKKVLAKNAMALGVMRPEEPAAQEYFERERQVIGAVSNHNFESGINLGGVMLIHFSRQRKKAEDDKLIGWTVVHDYGDNYRAYFQWIEDGEPSYADFEFDYAKKRLRGRNLLASNFMNMGRDFEPTERVGINPSNYNPEATRPRDRWTGPFRKACATAKYRTQCAATDKLLQDKAMIAAVEWLLTVKADSIQEFNACKKSVNGAAPPCSWAPEPLEDGVYRIKYNYDLKSTGKGEIAWEIDLKKDQITPHNDLAELAFRAVHSRKGLGL
jgi:predicted RNA binding protein YcfA (HicA-like mRNA interferase family)